MRWMGCLLLILSAPSWAEGEKVPYRGPFRKAVDEGGAVSITIPKRWADKERAGEMLIHVMGAGGHDITVTRESGQGDVDALRDRYLQHDNGRYAGSSVKKIEEPYFGYRLHIPEKKQVVVRAFASQGNAGLILTITSRDARYDKLYKDKLAWVASTLTVDGSRTGGYSDSGGSSGLPGRFWDESGAVSIVAPGGWRPIELQGDEVLCVARRGKAGEPRLFVNKLIGAGSASLAITKIARDWKVSYKNARFERLEGDPPRMVVHGRDGDWVDYIVGSFDGQVAYAVRLTTRRGSYDKLRPVADAAAKSIAFATAPWFEPTPPSRDLTEEYKKVLVLHAAAEQSGSLEKIGAEFDGFLKVWSKVGVGFNRRAPPLAVVVCAREDFAEDSNHFGRQPAAYDRGNRCVVVTPMPSKKPEPWRGALYAAFAEACLHRDLKAPPPPWFRLGLAACLRAAGQSDGKASAEIPEYAGRLQQRLGSNTPETIARVAKWTEGNFRRDATLDKGAHAWGYVHLMLFGKGKVAGTYKKWKKALAKARNSAPPFKPKKSDGAAELKAHIEKEWGAGG
ncbi:MAG: hypothetical protein ACYS0E_14260 [Planctomycetota bacterium]